MGKALRRVTGTEGTLSMLSTVAIFIVVIILELTVSSSGPGGSWNRNALPYHQP